MEELEEANSQIRQLNSQLKLNATRWVTEIFVIINVYHYCSEAVENTSLMAYLPIFKQGHVFNDCGLDSY